MSVSQISGVMQTMKNLSVNKFVTSFEFLQEDDEVGNESYLSNETSYNFNDSYSIKYRTRRNKKTDFTEFYNLIYQYQIDCLTAAVEYNKEYYNTNPSIDDSNYDKLKKKYDYLLLSNPQLKEFDDLGIGTSPSSKFKKFTFYCALLSNFLKGSYIC